MFQKTVIRGVLILAFACACAFAQQYPWVRNYTTDPTTAPVQFKAACENSSGLATICTTSPTRYLGICVNGCGLNQEAQIAFAGVVPVTVDATTTASHYCTVSLTVGGDCTDTGATTYPTSGIIIGKVKVVSTGAASLSMVDVSPEILGNTGAGGAVTVSGSPVSTNIACFTSGTNVTGCKASDVSATLYVAGGGTAQAQTVTLAPAVTALTNGLTFCFLPLAANTAAAPTIALNGLTAKPVTKLGTTALVANDMTTSGVACVIYDGTEYQLQNPQTTPAATLSALGGQGKFLLGMGYTDNAGSGVAIAANRGRVYRFSIDGQFRFDRIRTAIKAAGAAGTGYKAAIYSFDRATRRCDLGAVVATATGLVTLTVTGTDLDVTGGVCILNSGGYSYIETSDSTAVTLQAILDGDGSAGLSLLQAGVGSSTTVSYLADITSNISTGTGTGLAWTGTDLSGATISSLSPTARVIRLVYAANGAN